MIKELMKDVENIKGDIAQNYLTIPIKYGEKFTKILAFILVIFTLDPIYFLWKYPEMGLMKYYFYFTGIVFLIFLYLLWKATSKKDYLILHNIVKLIIVIGVISLVLIDTSVILKKILEPL
jgi:4-hydroxybenzoate polyprenyltransferase